MNIYNHILASKKEGKKLFALLIDPDKQDKSALISVIEKAKPAKADFFFVGGSLLTNDSLDACLSTLKENSNKSLFDMWQFAPQFDIIQMSHEKMDSKMFIT